VNKHTTVNIAKKYPKKDNDVPGPSDYVNVEGFRKTSSNMMLFSKSDKPEPFKQTADFESVKVL
jgi:hypothetical protein